MKILKGKAKRFLRIFFSFLKYWINESRRIRFDWKFLCKTRKAFKPWAFLLAKRRINCENRPNWPINLWLILKFQRGGFLCSATKFNYLNSLNYFVGLKKKKKNEYFISILNDKRKEVQNAKKSLINMLRRHYWVLLFIEINLDNLNWEKKLKLIKIKN